jgi:hypothetical protein
MRTLPNQLTTAQQSDHYRLASPTLSLAGVDRSAILAHYTYRERALRSAHSRVYLNNTTGSLNTLLSLGATVDLGRGALIDGVAYRANLPRLWVNRVTLDRRWYVLECIGFWGKLARWRAPATYVWTSTTIGAIIDDLFAMVGGLTREGAVATTTSSYTLNENEPGHLALRELVYRSSHVPYAGLAGAVKFKNLESDTTPIYTYGWNTDHPVRDVNYSPGLARYNRVTVIGADDPGTGLPITETADDLLQQSWAGIRLLTITDPALTTAFLVRLRAKGELAMHMALASRSQPVTLPNHGLELYDLCTLATTPWGGESYTIRCAGYTEEYRPRHYYQRWFPYSYYAAEYIG